MESFLRRHGIWIKLGLVAIAALLCSMVVNHIVAAQLAPYTVPAIEVAKAAAKKEGDRARRVAPVRVDLSRSIAQRCLFGCPEEERDPNVCEPACELGFGCQEGQCVPQEEQGPAEVVDLNLPQPSDLNVQLLGVIVADRSEYSSAIVRNPAGGQTYMVGVGEVLEGAEVVDIKRERIIIRRNGRLEYLQLESSLQGAPTTVSTAAPGRPLGGGAALQPERSGPPPEPQPAAEKKARAEEGPLGTKRIGDNRFEMPKAELERALEDPAKLASSATIVPNYRDNKKVGLKVIGISKDSLFNGMGIENGDVLQSINGTTVSSRAQALELLERASQKGRLEFEVERRGKTEQLRFDLK